MTDAFQSRCCFTNVFVFYQKINHISISNLFDQNDIKNDFDSALQVKLTPSKIFTKFEIYMTVHLLQSYDAFAAITICQCICCLSNFWFLYDVAFTSTTVNVSVLKFCN